MRAMISAALAALAAGAAHAAPPIASGAYDNTLLIGVDPATGAVSGYFNMTQGEQPVFNCTFYLKGRLAGRSAAVDSYFLGSPGDDDRIKGSLTALAPGKVRVALPTEHGGCGNVWHFADASQPADFELQGAARPWIAVRVLKAAKAYFSPAPGAPHGKAYIVQDDGVGVRAAQSGWVQADFVGETRTSSGWLKESDLYAP